MAARRRQAGGAFSESGQLLATAEIAADKCRLAAQAASQARVAAAAALSVVEGQQHLISVEAYDASLAETDSADRSARSADEHRARAEGSEQRARSAYGWAESALVSGSQGEIDQALSIGEASAKEAEHAAAEALEDALRAWASALTVAEIVVAALEQSR